MNARRRQVTTELELRVRYQEEPGVLASLLKVLRQVGGDVLAHLVYRIDEEMVGLFVCERPTEAALALKERGFSIETETVVVVRAENQSGAFSHLVRVLETENVGVAYTYASSCGADFVVIFRTDDNPKAEDLLENYLAPEAFSR